MRYSFERDKITHCGQCPCFNDDGGGCLLAYGYVDYNSEKPGDCPLRLDDQINSLKSNITDSMTVREKGKYLAGLLDTFKWPQDKPSDDCYEALRTAQHLLYNLYQLEYKDAKDGECG